MEIAGLIVAAGKQNRFDMQIPKALVPYKDSTLLEYNIKTMDLYCSKIYVVCSKEDYDLFQPYRSEKVYVFPICSGFGCGDAVLEGLNAVEEQSVITIWGDSVQTNRDV